MYVIKRLLIVIAILAAAVYLIRLIFMVSGYIALGIGCIAILGISARILTDSIRNRMASKWRGPIN